MRIMSSIKRTLLNRLVVVENALERITETMERKFEEISHMALHAPQANMANDDDFHDFLVLNFDFVGIESTRVIR